MLNEFPKRPERGAHLRVPAVALTNHPQQILERAQRNKGPKMRFLHLGERTAPTIAGQERFLERSEIGMAGQAVERHGQIVEPVTIATVIEVDGAGLSVMEQIVPLMQVGMDQAKDIRLVA